MNQADVLFDAAVLARYPALALRPETAAEAGFLAALFAACSPLAGLLPAPMLEQQALAQQAGYRTEFPLAMRRIIFCDGSELGRVVIDWSGTANTSCVDIAVMPAAQRRGIGSALLKAWIETASALNRPCALQVAVGNPAQQIYARLGFALDPAADSTGPIVAMIRPVGPLAA